MFVCIPVVKTLAEHYRGLTSFLENKSKFLKTVYIFWLLGPFFLLIERTPADVWLSVSGLAFVYLCYREIGFDWLKREWVVSIGLFWVFCVLSSVVSPLPSKAFAESFIWLRFPLFAFACCFLFAADRRMLNAMLWSIGISLVLMCCILTVEIIYQGHTQDRLTWPFGDKVSGNFLAKVGLPIAVVLTWCSVKCKLGVSTQAMALLALFIGFTVLTGERINALLIFCTTLLVLVLSTQKLTKLITLFCGLIFVIGSVFCFYPTLRSEFIFEAFNTALSFSDSGWGRTMLSGWIIFLDNPFFGIGVGNFRELSAELLAGVAHARPDNHPHNFYIQLLTETGLVGFLLAVNFVFRLLRYCVPQNYRVFTSHPLGSMGVVVLACFWPITSSGDFFGQWNNIFLWSSVGIALASIQHVKAAASE